MAMDREVKGVLEKATVSVTKSYNSSRVAMVTCFGFGNSLRVSIRRIRYTCYNLSIP